MGCSDGPLGPSPSGPQQAAPVGPLELPQTSPGACPLGPAQDVSTTAAAYGPELLPLVIPKRVRSARPPPSRAPPDRVPSVQNSHSMHRLHIVGDVRHAVRHCLLANPGVKIENVRSAMSHPQTLVQCEYTLTEFGIEHRGAVDDTAGAEKEQMLQDTSAIASSLAAELYGLNVLTENIQDDKDNVTRFMMLAREPIIPRTDKPFKTSIVFSLEEGPRQLFKALGVFALREINLTKIESRPHKKMPLRIADDNYLPLMLNRVCNLFKGPGKLSYRPERGLSSKCLLQITCQ
ncbi:hypothetical protein GUJ93_ZPchr0013g35468 [Zizania palustris]|uniref:Prephenate dehydratase domain-containing protein n=1 Tax=Zizania palustris TaxID=103762 RepID=A0A8J6BU61_ZIZPA|nr:hypothetical protein GUJ93_ZPchr0013g35468 [Zizania palustris]